MESKIARLAAKRGQAPPAVTDGPELEDHLRAYFSAFNSLDSCRQLGFGDVGPIPWSAVDAYGYRYGFTGDLFDDLVVVLRAMDAAATKIRREKSTPPAREKDDGPTSGVRGEDAPPGK